MSENTRLTIVIPRRSLNLARRVVKATGGQHTLAGLIRGSLHRHVARLAARHGIKDTGRVVRLTAGRTRGVT